MGYVEDMQTLRLLKAFAKIRDPAVRREIIDQAEARVPTDDPERAPGAAGPAGPAKPSYPQR